MNSAYLTMPKPLVASDTGKNQQLPTNANQPSLPSHYLSRNGSPYRVVLDLNYGGCSYALLTVLLLSSMAFHRCHIATTFCEGGNVVLQASGGTAFSWLRNGFPIAGSNASTIIANQAGTYQCQITGSGTCSGSSNSIAVNVLPNPAIAFTTSCYNSDSAEIRVTSPGAVFLDYRRHNLLHHCKRGRRFRILCYRDTVQPMPADQL